MRIDNQLRLFGKRGGSNKWKAEYDDTLYKIYDWGGNLAGYLFPAYSNIEPKDEEIIVELNRIHAQVTEGTLLLPMVKLNLLDNNEGMDIDYVIHHLKQIRREPTGGKSGSTITPNHSILQVLPYILQGKIATCFQ